MKPYYQDDAVTMAESLRLRAVLEGVERVECGCRGEAANHIESHSRRGTPAHPGPAPHGAIEVSR